ncbi:AAA family ATPase [Pelagicoccus sp. NFK12]|uniref:AAA family ATPase n=1 Tax=Pelagicoccus enzymogenes TaxID=2773457 RepID=A0A927F5N5_9BACT|nr:AAA family ATPase [Pelagicoccus enzymogenes]MBD5778854.1 AAA family ATPase [Pelagicoccus enzymogenes]
MSSASTPSPITEGRAQAIQTKLRALTGALNQVLFGQARTVELVVVALLARGHVLLEGLPGLGKTELVKALSKAIQLKQNRVQFTPDLLPGDITGNPVLQESPSGERSFVFQEGPLFAELLLADEINRASPKTQSALLEAMQERSVSVFGTSHRLPEPFFVFATQNPIELEGTYPLPEAQIDRFLFKLSMERGDRSVIEKIVQHRDLGGEVTVEQVMTREELLEASSLTREVFLPPAVVAYIARLVEATHVGNSKAADGVRFGCSPRAAISLAASARARALLNGRVYSNFEDVEALAIPVLQHRIIMDYQARVEGVNGATVVNRLLEEISPDGVDLPESLKSAKL